MAVRYSKLGGQNSLSYLGVESVSPPPFIAVDRAPRNVDTFGPIDDEFLIGTLWLDTSVDDMWILSSLHNHVPDWVRLTEVFDNVLQIESNAGTIYPLSSDGSVKVLGGLAISTTAVVNTLSLNLNNGANGQLLIAATGSDTTWATIASSATVNVTNGANTINIESVVAKAFDTLTGDGGTATPVAGKIDIIGGINIDTSAIGDTITVLLADSPDISGVLTLSLLAAEGVLKTNSVGTFSTSAGTDGQILVAGGTTPTWMNIISGDASISITDGANSINLETSSAPGLNTLTADDSNTAAASLGKIDLVNGGSIDTYATGDTLTISLEDTPEVTGDLTLTPLVSEGILSTNGSGVVISSVGNNGQVLIGGGTAPAWANITAGSNIAVTSGANTLAIDSTKSIPSGSYSFMAYQPTTFEIGFGIQYYLGRNAVLTEVFDNGSNFYPGNALGSEAYYTAPVDGIYWFQYNHVAIYITPPTPPPVIVRIDPPIYVTISTSARDYQYAAKETFFLNNASNANFSMTIVLDAGDQVRFWASVELEHVGIHGDATDAYSYVSGYLISAN